MFGCVEAIFGAAFFLLRCIGFLGAKHRCVSLLFAIVGKLFVTLHLVFFQPTYTIKAIKEL